MIKIIVLACMLLLLTMTYPKMVYPVDACLKLSWSSEQDACLKKVVPDKDAIQYELGDIYYSKGYYYYKQAAYWYTQAAKQGNAKAQDNLGVMYFEGKGITKNYKQAAYWVIQSANQGNANAQFTLGNIYYDGVGAVQSDIKAYAWLSIATHNSQSDKRKRFEQIESNMLPDDINKAQDLAQELLKTIKK